MKYRLPFLIMILLGANLVVSNQLVNIHHSLDPRTSESFLDLNDQVKVDGISREWILFATTDKEFQLLKTLQPEDLFPNLMAVRLSESSQQIKRIMKGTSISAYKSSLFELANMHDTPYPSINSISLSSTDEANMIGLSNLWDQGYNGTGVSVGIIDNGVNFNHQGLENQLQSSANFNTTGDPVINSHGTSVAGVLAGDGTGTTSNSGKGMAFGSKISAANLGTSAEGFLVGDFLAAFEWLIDSTNVSIINTSWGGGDEAIWNSIVNRLEELKILVVGSAGNLGSGNFNTKGSPGNAIGGISAGALSVDGDLAGFSSQGPVGGGFQKPDLLAPGSSVLTTSYLGGYTRVTGTSFSSPIIAGAASVLISALEQNQIPWNVGTLKASLMLGAAEIDGPESRTGKGLINVTRSWEILQSANSDGNGPQVLEVTPRNNLFHQLTNLRQNIKSQVPLTVISSHPQTITASVRGNFSDIISIPTMNSNRKTQELWLDIDTTQAIEGVYIGEIYFSQGGIDLFIPLQFLVDEPPTFKILFDLRHTNRDDGYTNYRAGYLTGTFIEEINKMGGWVDMVNETFSSALLQHYDLLWLVDPFWENSGLNLTDSELQVLKDYVASGGNLFVNYFGVFTDEFSVDQSNLVFGNKISDLNKIITEFDMEGNSTALDAIPYFISESSPSFDKLINYTSISKGVEQVSAYLSSRINFEGRALSISNKGFLGIYSSIGSGRVAVTSTYGWFSSSVAQNIENSNERQLMRNLVSWLTSSSRLEIDHVIKNGRSIEVFFEVSGSVSTLPRIIDLNSEVEGTVEAISNNRFSGKVLVPSGVNVTTLEISAGSEYLKIDAAIDVNLPRIVPKTIDKEFSTDGSIEFEFTITDDVELDESSLVVSLNDEFHSDFIFETGELIVRINAGTLDPGDYELVIKISDTSNNEESYTHFFKITNGNDSNGSFLVIDTLLLIPAMLLLRYFTKRKLCRTP